MIRKFICKDGAVFAKSTSFDASVDEVAAENMAHMQEDSIVESIDENDTIEVVVEPAPDAEID